MTDLVKRLRDWPCIYPEDLYEPEGYLYEVAADRIEALEAEIFKAREEGRKAGLEEAAKVACALRKGGREIGYYEGWDDALDIAEQRIRALAQTSTPEGEG